jgi:hypothetical protein
LRLDGEFLGSVALFTIDRTLSHPPHLFNEIQVRAVGRPMKNGARDCDTDCIERFFRLIWFLTYRSIIFLGTPRQKGENRWIWPAGARKRRGADGCAS